MQGCATDVHEAETGADQVCPVCLFERRRGFRKKGLQCGGGGHLGPVRRASRGLGENRTWGNGVKRVWWPGGYIRCGFDRPYAAGNEIVPRRKRDQTKVITLIEPQIEWQKKQTPRQITVSAVAETASRSARPACGCLSIRDALPRATTPIRWLGRSRRPN